MCWIQTRSHPLRNNGFGSKKVIIIYFYLVFVFWGIFLKLFQQTIHVKNYFRKKEIFLKINSHNWLTWNNDLMMHFANNEMNLNSN